MSQKRAVDRYLKRIQGPLLLADWSFCYRPDLVCSLENAAEIQIYEGHTADLAICPEFWDWPTTKQRAILVHELCHAHFDRLRAIDSLLPRHHSPEVLAVLRGVLIEAEEHAVETMARLLASRLPLPKFGK